MTGFVKPAKMNVRDNLVFHTLLGLEGSDSLLEKPITDTSKEGHVVEGIIAGHEHWTLYF